MVCADEFFYDLAKYVSVVDSFDLFRDVSAKKSFMFDDLPAGLFLIRKLYAPLNIMFHNDITRL